MTKDLVSWCKAANTQREQDPSTRVAAFAWIHRQLLADLTIDLVSITHVQHSAVFSAIYFILISGINAHPQITFST